MDKQFFKIMNYLGKNMENDGQKGTKHTFQNSHYLAALKQQHEEDEKKQKRQKTMRAFSEAKPQKTMKPPSLKELKGKKQLRDTIDNLDMNKRIVYM